MTLTIEVSPEKAEAFKAQAKTYGLTVEQSLLQLADKSAATLLTLDQNSPDTWEDEFEGWLNSLPDTPAPSDEAISRANLYR